MNAEKELVIPRFNALTSSLKNILDNPGSPTSGVVAYIHKGASRQSHLDVSTKEDAELLLAEVEMIASKLRGFIRTGRI